MMFFVALAVCVVIPPCTVAGLAWWALSWLPPVLLALVPSVVFVLLQAHFELARIDDPMGIGHALVCSWTVSCPLALVLAHVADAKRRRNGVRGRAPREASA